MVKMKTSLKITLILIVFLTLSFNAFAEISECSLNEERDCTLPDTMEDPTRGYFVDKDGVWYAD